MNIPKKGRFFTTFYNPPTPEALGLKLVSNFTFSPLFALTERSEDLAPETRREKKRKNI
jgi:hypothetical protein